MNKQRLIAIVDGLLGDGSLCNGCSYGKIKGYDEYGSCDKCRRIAAKEIIKILKRGNRPIGKWISQHSKDWKGGGAEICSECGYGYSWGAYHEPDEFKFCPNCGVKMEGDKSALSENRLGRLH